MSEENRNMLNFVYFNYFLAENEPVEHGPDEGGSTEWSDGGERKYSRSRRFRKQNPQG